MVNILGNLIAWMKNFLHDLGLDQTLESVGTNSMEVAQSVVLLIAGFVVAFLASRYFKYVFFAVLILALGVRMLEYRGLLTVDWNQLYHTIGVDSGLSVDSLQALAMSYFEWMKSNAVAAISMLLGAYFGIRAS